MVDDTSAPSDGVPKRHSERATRDLEAEGQATRGKEPGRERPEREKVLQNTNEGYVETDVDEIPLSEATGEGRNVARNESRSAKSN